MTAATPTKTQTKLSRHRDAGDESQLCQFPFADGRTCRMLRYASHPTLCIFHARQEQELVLYAQQLQDFETIAAELASASGSLRSMTEIHNVITKLFQLVAANRIPRRHAQLLAYLAQMLLHSQPSSAVNSSKASAPATGARSSARSTASPSATNIPPASP